MYLEAVSFVTNVDSHCTKNSESATSSTSAAVLLHDPIHTRDDTDRADNDNTRSEVNIPPVVLEEIRMGIKSSPNNGIITLH